MRRLVRELDPGVTERNYAKEPLTEAELKGILQAAGGVAAVLNTRHATAKANGWTDAPPSPSEFIAAVREEPNLIRRPILVHGGRAVVGRDEMSLRSLLA